MANEIINRTVNIFIQSGEAQRALDGLLEKEKKIREELQKIGNPEAIKNLKTELGNLSAPIDAAKKAAGEAAKTLNTLVDTEKQLKQELASAVASPTGTGKKTGLSTDQIKVEIEDVKRLQLETKKAAADAKNQLDALIRKENELKEAIRKASDPQNVKRLNDELKKLEEPIDRAKKKISGELEPSLKDTQSTATKLRNELSRMSENDPKFKERVGQYAQANKELEAQRGKVGLLSRAWKSFAQEVKTVAIGVIVGNTIQSALQTVLGYVSGIVTGSAKIADELSDIEKTTGLTKDEVQKVNSELSKIDTRTSSSQLRQLAVEAGKLGKDSVEDIVKFVKQADQIRVALGEDLGEDAIISIGRLSKIFKTEMLNIGSAINEIGASSEASERFAVDFLNRLAGTGPAVKLSAADLLGYGAALENAGQTAEVSGTSLSNFFIDFVRDSEKFGKAAGFANGELSKLINEKGTNAGFLEFITRLKQANPAAEEFLKRMQELGIDGSRGANVMLALANNIEEIRKQQLIANKAIVEGTSLTNEFSKKNNNAGAELDKLKKNIASIFTSRTFQEGSEFLIRSTNSFIKALKAIPFPVTIAGFTALIGILGLYVAAKAKSISATIISTAVETAANIQRRISTLVTQVAAANEVIFNTVKLAQAGIITRATAAYRIWNAVVSLGAGPLGLAILAIGALVFALSSVVNKTNELTTAQKLASDVAKKVADATGDTVARIKLLEDVLKDENVQYSVKERALKKLIEINPEFANTLKLNKDGTVEGTKAIADYIGALTKQAEAQAKFELFVEKSKQRTALINKFRAQTPGADLLTDDEIIEKGRQAARVAGRFGDLQGDFKTFVELTNEIDTLGKGLKQLRESALNAGNDLGGGLGGGAKDALGLIEQLEKNIADLTESRKKSKSKTEIADYNKQIKEAEKQLAQLRGETTKLSSIEKKAATDTKALTEELRQLATSLLPEDTQREKFEKEIQALDDKYAKLRERIDKLRSTKKESDIKAANKLQLQLETLYQIERANLIDKFARQEEKNFQEALNARKDHEAEEAKKRQEFLNGIQPLLTKTVETNARESGAIDQDVLLKDQLDIEQKLGKARLEAQLKFLNDQEKQAIAKKDEELSKLGHNETNQKKLIEDQKLQIEEEFRKKRKEAELNHLTELLQQLLSWANQSLQIISVFSDIKSQKENAELARDKAIHDKKKSNLDKRLKAGLISQQQFDRETEKLQKKQDAKEKEVRLKQFQRDKRAQIAQAIMSGAEAVVSTLAARPGSLDVISLGVFRAINIGLAIAATAAQVAKIASAPPPQFAKGGKLNGRSHSQGGIPVMDHFGRKQAELEGEEAIINKFSMRDRTRYTVSGTPSQIASSLNARHGGVHWESGATLTPAWKTRKPQPMNFAVIRQAQHYAAGGTFQKTTSAPASTTTIETNSGDGQIMMMTVLTSLVASVDNLNARLQAGIVAKTFLTEQEAQQDRLNKIREDSTFKP